MTATVTISSGGPRIDVKSYGALGDGVTDDTAAFQAAINDARAVNGTVIVPASNSGYVISSTLSVTPTSGATTDVSIRCEGGQFFEIIWAGANNTSVFRTLGLKRARWEGVRIRLNGKTGVVGFDIDSDNTRASTGQLNFTGCAVTCDSSCSACVGWRVGHSGGLDASVILWNSCNVEADAEHGHTGWVWEHQNCLGFTWINCGSSHLATSWTGLSTTGSALGQNGGDGMTIIGAVCSYNLIDLAPANGGTYTIIGGRFELGNRLISIAGGGGATSFDLSVVGATVADYAPSDGIVFYLDVAASLVLEGCTFPRTSGAFDANFIKGGGGRRNISLIGCSINTSVDPPVTLTATTTLTVLGGAVISTAGAVTSSLTQQVPADRLGVGNAASATTPGTVVKKFQVFDKAGTSLGYVPVYDAIT